MECKVKEGFARNWSPRSCRHLGIGVCLGLSVAGCGRSLQTPPVGVCWWVLPATESESGVGSSPSKQPGATFLSRRLLKTIDYTPSDIPIVTRMNRRCLFILRSINSKLSNYIDMSLDIRHVCLCSFGPWAKEVSEKVKKGGSRVFEVSDSRASSGSH
ncbi:uncharacterized protein B0H64DRAFT_208826 [Chaetomium fimeti]|uniref:Uncharacterized protein n=1 Tax=Chaetomium fimeti TaxID=1854472 RepID=A0AAE0LQK1_9PEZI|nr:hypothetical protein B0H64DRAFT_208826 [Chaetomium fimeti]